MHEELKQIPGRILETAIGALAQANRNATFWEPSMDHWDRMGILNAASAGELFLKAIIAKEHPLLLFRDLFQLDDPNNVELTIQRVIERGRTYNLEHLPKLLWVATGNRIPDLENFERLRKARNAIQHFCVPEDQKGLNRLTLEFLYNNIDPLINEHLGICAIEHHEDLDGYDTVVARLIANELLFSVPDDFSTELDLQDYLSGTSNDYRSALVRRLEEKGVRVS